MIKSSKVQSVINLHREMQNAFNDIVGLFQNVTDKVS